MLLLRIQEHCFCMCENNPCTYSTLCEDWSLFTGNYCFYKENLAWQLYGLEFHEASSQRKQLLHLTQFAAVLKTPISSEITAWIILSTI